MNLKTQAVLNLMKSNLHRKSPISELAQSVSLSHSRLCYLFKTELGISPLKYLKMLRMQKARELLGTSLLGVKQIAAMVGYDDDSHFMRDFKKTYGLTPSQYRAQYLEAIVVMNEVAMRDAKIG